MGQAGNTGFVRRRNYFIDRKFQTKFIIEFCLLVAITVLVIMAILYILSKKATTVSFVNSRVVVQSTADFLFPILVQTVIIATAVVSVATILIVLFISHSIAGPAYRFKKVLSSLGYGDFSGECRIRRTDALQDVAGVLNETMSKIRSVLKDLDSSLLDLKGKLEKGASPEELKKTVSDIDRKLRYFKF